MNLKQQIKAKIKELGDKAPEFFGKKQTTINTWLKTGNYPIYAVEKVLSEQTGPAETQSETISTTTSQSEVQQQRESPNSVVPPQPQVRPPQSTSEILGALQNDIQIIVNHINAELAPAIKALQELTNKHEQYLTTPKQPAPTLGQAMQNETPNLTRPNVQTLATYQEPIGGGPARQVTEPQNTGIAPTAEQVALSRVQVDGLPPGQQGRLAGPAQPPPPEVAAMGVLGWTKPYEPRK